MGWKSYLAIAVYFLLLLGGLCLIARVWWLSKSNPTALSSLEERLRACLFPSMVVRRMLWTGVCVITITISLSALAGIVGGWWYKSIMRGLSERLSDTFKESREITFQSPQTIPRKEMIAPESGAPSENDPAESGSAEGDNDNEGIDTASRFSFSLGNGEGEIYEEIFPKLKPRKLRFDRILATYDGKPTKIFTREDETSGFVSEILAGPVQVRRTHADEFGYYALKTQAPTFMTEAALLNAQQYFRDDVTAMKVWIWSMFWISLLLFHPFLFLFVCITRGHIELANLRNMQDDAIKALLKSGPIQWLACPEARLRRLPSLRVLGRSVVSSESEWTYGVQLRGREGHHIRVSYRALPGQRHQANAGQALALMTPQIDHQALPQGRLATIRVSNGSPLDRFPVFVPDFLIAEINDYHTKAWPPTKRIV